jgi:hypothetical protein
MRLIPILLLTISVCVSVSYAHPARKPVEVVKIKIEANEWDKNLILKKLNEHGADHAIRFETSEEHYDYRIDFGTGQNKNTLLGLAGAGAVNYSKAQVTAYDLKGTELFQFQRENRYTDSGATNAAAKEIVKRLLKLRSLASR